MDAIFADFAVAQNQENGYLLASTISPEQDPARLYAFVNSTDAHAVETDLRYKIKYNPDIKLDKQEQALWLDIFVCFYRCAEKIVAAEQNSAWTAVYNAWKDVVNALLRGYSSGVLLAWTIPCLYTAGKFLRVFAIKADSSSASMRDSGMSFGGLQEEDAFGSGGKHEKLEDAARQINRIFAICISDRAPLDESRKWALYYIANLLFKTYFRLSSISLSKNILRSLSASSSDMPPLSQFPRAHQVTHNYYVGVLAFLEEDYATAESHLTAAYNLCHINHASNRELILTYLIPTKLLTTHRLPTPALLNTSPKLSALFTPIAAAIRNADLRALDAGLSAGEAYFVHRRIYLTLERSRDIVLRNLFRKVFLAGGFEPPKEGDTTGAQVRRSRVPIAEFAAALSLAGDEDAGDGEQVECVVANCIYKGLMKGYIARDRGIVVLAKNGAFPDTGV